MVDELQSNQQQDHPRIATSRPCLARLSKAAFLLASIFAIGCAKPSPKPQKPIPLVSAIRLAPQSTRVFRDYVGRTNAFLTVDIRPQITAPVLRFYFQDGQQVRQGQLLYQLDARPFQTLLDAATARRARTDADIARATAELAKTQDYVRRYAPLATINAVPRQQYTDALAQASIAAAQLQQAQADKQIAQANLEQAQLNLTYTQVRAPIAGTVGIRRMAPGALATPTDPEPLATISSADPLRVDFSVSDADYLKYLAPQTPSSLHNLPPTTRTNNPRSVQWKLILADGSAYPLPGKFYALSRAANLQTDTVQVELLYPNPRHQLRPGQYATIHADVESRQNVLLVPVSSVRVAQGTKIVSVVGPNNIVAEKTIETESRSGDAYIVKKGLSPGDIVIIGGEQKVKPGDKVKPQLTNLSAQDAAS